jgi:hypothetical protein
MVKIILFLKYFQVTLSNDTSSDPDQLLDLILNNANYYGGTNFTHAVETIQAQMENTWSTERSVFTIPSLLILLELFSSPVVIFLSDGECAISDSTIYDLCRAAVRLG